MVEFGKEWPEFSNAMMFVKDFEVNEHGRNDWYDGPWMAVVANIPVECKGIHQEKWLLEVNK